MKRKCLAVGINTVAVILLILGSLSNVVGYQTVKSTTLPDSISSKITINNDDPSSTASITENWWPMFHHDLHQRLRQMLLYGIIRPTIRLSPLQQSLTRKSILVPRIITCIV